MTLSVWRYEVTRVGRSALAGPAAVAIGLIVLSMLLTASGTPTPQADRILVGLLEAGLPLVAGVSAASVIGRDTAIELQLSLPADYRTTLLRRVLVAVGWPAVLALTVAIMLAGVGRWPSTHAPLTGQLIWLAPLLWLVGLGLAVAVLVRSGAIAGTVVAALWLCEELFAGLFAQHEGLRSVYLFATSRLSTTDGWVANRTMLVLTAAGLLLLAWLVLARPERLLVAEDA